MLNNQQPSIHEVPSQNHRSKGRGKGKNAREPSLREAFGGLSTFGKGTKGPMTHIKELPTPFYQVLREIEHVSAERRPTGAIKKASDCSKK